jgi:hypothetical protein
MVIFLKEKYYTKIHYICIKEFKRRLKMGIDGIFPNLFLSNL